MAVWFRCPALNNNTVGRLMSKYPIGIHLHRDRDNGDNVMMSFVVYYLHPCFDRVDCTVTACLVRTYGGQPTALTATANAIGIMLNEASQFALCTVSALDRAVAAAEAGRVWIYFRITNFIPAASISGLCLVLDKSNGSALNILSEELRHQLDILQANIKLVTADRQIVEDARQLAEQALTQTLSRTDTASAPDTAAPLPSVLGCRRWQPSCQAHSPPKRLPLLFRISSRR